MPRSWFVLAVCGCATAGQSPGDAPHHGDDAAGVDSSRDAPPGSCANPTTGTIATWSFIGEPGSQLMTAAVASMTAAGVTAGPVSRSAGLVVASGVGSINSSNWALGSALDVSKYYTFSVMPQSGCTLALSSLAIDTKSSGTGPTLAAVATSTDSFGQTSPVTTNSAGTSNLLVSGATGMVELRVFGYGASGSGGTMRIQNTLTLTGSLQ
jgi:hypothetical protein